jgi:hypothetical protein
MLPKANHYLRPYANPSKKAANTHLKHFKRLLATFLQGKNNDFRIPIFYLFFLQLVDTQLTLTKEW